MLNEKDRKAYEHIGIKVTEIMGSHIATTAIKEVEKYGPKEKVTPESLSGITLALAKEVGNLQSLITHSLVKMISKTLGQTLDLEQCPPGIEEVLYDAVMGRMKTLSKFTQKTKSKMNWR